ncbi:MAG: penicillin-binding protein 2 [Fimbriimonadaceae bacterium]|nr:penicillin-binding protein 2 [Fimbriimonadaceae bacterium]
MSVIHAPRENPIDFRQFLIPAILLLIFAIFFFRLWFLQVAGAPSLKEQGERSREASVSRLAPRGKIFDRKGIQLAGVRSVLVATAVPNRIRHDDSAMKELGAILGITSEEILKKFDAKDVAQDLPAVIAQDVSIEAATRLAEARTRLEGIGIETLPMRRYADTKSLATVLGYVWVPTERETKRLEDHGIKPADFVGREGIEKEYEAELMGDPGVDRLLVDARRRPIRSLASDNPQPGRDLVLGIDFDLQKYAFEMLRGRKGAVVALDPRNGDVLCMVSSPTYDTAQFIGGISQAEYSLLRDDPNKPLYARAMQGEYQPGSTFKILTTMAGMRAGTFDPNRPALCRGYYAVGNRRFKCLGTHGSVTFKTAMAKSCNAYFADLAVRTGEAEMLSTASELHFGTQLGLDLPDGRENDGVLPTPEFWEKRHPDRPFGKGDLVNFGVGQGELLVTPLQMASMMGTVAMKGVQYRPRIVRGISDAEGKMTVLEPQEIARIQGTDSFWRQLQDALVTVVEAGTARSGRIAGISMAGKTGSAENAHGPLTHSWFIAFAPAENPKIAIAVMAENAGHGSTVAVPIASAVVRHYLNPPKPTTAPRPNQGSGNSIEFESEVVPISRP